MTARRPRSARFERIDELLCVAPSTATPRDELLTPSPPELLARKSVPAPPLVFGSPWLRPLELEAGRQARRAAWSGDASRLRQLHRKYPFALRACDERDASTPAHWACLAGHATVLQLLLLLGCDPEDLNTNDAKRQTPLHWAAMHGHRACVEALLEHDAPNGAGQTWVQRRDHRGRTPAHWAAINCHADLSTRLAPRRDASRSLARVSQDGVRAVTPSTPASPSTPAARSTPATPSAASWVQLNGSWQSPTSEVRRAVLSDCRQLLLEVEQLLTPQPPTRSARGWSASARSRRPRPLPRRWTEEAERERKEQNRADRLKRRQAKQEKELQKRKEESHLKQKERDRELQEARATHAAKKIAAREQADADKAAQMERGQKAKADADARAAQLAKEQDAKSMAEARKTKVNAEKRREDTERRRAEHAATKIAATQRGRQARARVQSIHKKLQEIEVFIGVEDNDSDTISDREAGRRPRQNSSFDQPVLALEEPPQDWALNALDGITDLIEVEESAASKIQAVLRGRRVRARLRVSSPPVH